MIASTAALLQGCAQCADSMRGAPADVQAAYRDAILLMMAAGAAVFGAAVWMMKDRK